MEVLRSVWNKKNDQFIIQLKPITPKEDTISTKTIDLKEIASALILSHSIHL